MATLPSVSPSHSIPVRGTDDHISNTQQGALLLHINRLSETSFRARVGSGHTSKIIVILVTKIVIEIVTEK